MFSMLYGPETSGQCDPGCVRRTYRGKRVDQSEGRTGAGAGYVAAERFQVMLSAAMLDEIRRALRFPV